MSHEKMVPEDEHNVPIVPSSGRLVEQEFDSVREKFELEMGKMEEEMARFRSLLIAAQSNQVISETSTRNSSSSSSQLRTTSSSILESTNSSSCSSKSITNKAKQEHHQASNWLVGLESPLINHEQETGSRVLRLRFDVSLYEPEQILVKTIGNRLLVEASRADRSENQSSYSEYRREFLLPSETDPQLVKSSLSADGILTVEAPLPDNLL